MHYRLLGKASEESTASKSTSRSSSSGGSSGDDKSTGNDTASYSKTADAYKEAWNAHYNDKGTEGKNRYNVLSTNLANAMEMYSAGASYDAASMVSSDVSVEAWNKAKNLADSGISPTTLQSIASSMDSNGNGNYTKDEITSYLDNSNYSQTQKAYLFAAFASWKNAQNTY